MMTFQISKALFSSLKILPSKLVYLSSFVNHIFKSVIIISRTFLNVNIFHVVVRDDDVNRISFPSKMHSFILDRQILL